MKFYYLFIFTFVLINIKAQSVDNDTKSNDEPVFSDVQVQAKFKGGEEALMYFLSRNLKYPKEAESKKIEGVVKVKFIIEKNGKVTNIEAINSKKFGYGLEEEAIRAVKMLPDWKPAKLNGRPVRSYFILPISFSLN